MEMLEESFPDLVLEITWFGTFGACEQSTILTSYPVRLQ